MTVTIAFDEGLAMRVNALAAGLKRRQWTLATAESCTGGLISAACTSVAGSSDWFERGFVTYSNDAKSESLGVPVTLIAEHGAVSREAALAMVEGALSFSSAHIAVAVTGIAGPGGGSKEKPVGTVWLALGLRGKQGSATLLHLQGSRTEIRSQTVDWALKMLQNAVDRQEAS